ncbi:hypothetical protein [Ruegeria sp. ANG-S4]|uniref:hypothetical protein n=1 Tax=Ruegeria sp. ANG-S4 TaxID=1577904 RepID=UPI000AF3DAE9|nr:hypothetical protein [Ruegeria sp. ANG-S4]
MERTNFAVAVAAVGAIVLVDPVAPRAPFRIDSGSQTNGRDLSADEERALNLSG